jgi:glycosyltransferase involved in cell wall biosynthesis
MKILMFGWEFPPHISGGLGTACYGLTSSLIREHIDVIFVVPKLFGSEPANGAKLISASDVSVGNYTEAKTRTELPGKSVRKTTTRKTTTIVKTNSPNLTTVEIPGLISSYNMAHVDEPGYGLEHWNYEFEKINHISDVRLRKTFKSTTMRSHPGKTYSFSGGYGPKLIEEVYRYADVASEVATHQSFDIVHAHDWMTFPAAIAAKKISGKPLVVHIHATEFDRAGRQGSEHVYRIEKEAMSFADRIVAVSSWTKKLLMEEYHVPGKKIDVVHNGIIPEAGHAKEEFHPIGDRVVTFLGRVTYQKGPEYFVEAAKKVLLQFPDAQFVMAGAGDILPQIITRVANLKMSSHFHFTGFLKKAEIDKILSYTRVYVMPSVSEPFGITPLEAILAGVPVIISKQSGVGEVVKHALKVDFWDTDALAQAMCSVLQYKSLADTLKKNSREEINRITWEKAAKKLNHIYHELTTTAAEAPRVLFPGSSAYPSPEVALL